MIKMPIIGWDVGGAHLKAAVLDDNGDFQIVLQVPCALWRGLNELEKAIDEILTKLGVSTALHAITMTGELVDLFANRQMGVFEISRVMQAKLSGTKEFYAGTLSKDGANFVTIDEVETNWQNIASANWMASASFVAKQVERGLLIDIGSTTADFVLFDNHQPICLGYTDAMRMQTEELIYTGVVRTPLMAITQKIKFQNTQTSTAAEYFSTTADIYRLTGDLMAKDDMADTADGKDKSGLASAQRIARMIGRDAADAPFDDWVDLAHAFKALQLLRIREVAEKHLARLNNNTNVSIIGAGAGSFLVREIAERLGLQYIETSDLLNDVKSELESKRWASVCLPAYAVAHLAFNNKNKLIK